MVQRVAKEAHYRCNHCGKQYVQEQAFLDHACTRIIREEILNTVNGQAALNYYQMWMRHQKRLVRGPDAFLSSQSFKAIVAFVEFVKKVKLLKPEMYIRYMVSRKYSPIMWIEDKVYVEYLEYLDNQVSPIEHAKITCETIMRVADHWEMDASEFFEQLPINRIIEMIRLKKLSPWLLLCSRSFLKMMQQDCNDEQRKILETIIRPDVWSEKMMSHMDDLKTIKLLVAELGI